MYSRVTRIFSRAHSTLAVIIVIAVSFQNGYAFNLASTNNSYDYEFSVDYNGFTRVTIVFSSSQTRGQSWVFVPKSENWTRKAELGSVFQEEILNTQEVSDVDNPFYEVYMFYFVSEGSFRTTFQFNMSVGAMIVEPRGMFLSPLVGYEENSDGKAKVFLPDDSRLIEAAALGKVLRYRPTKTTANYALFELNENIIRLQIEFRTDNGIPELSTLKQDIFTFRTVERYKGYASNILVLFEETYNDFTSLFNVTLESVSIEFFIPDFNTILSVGGYVPFSGGKVGDIHINLFFIRSLEGSIQIIALHELVHHFLMESDISPNTLLWFHEGMSQYISIETAELMGYEISASSERSKLEDSVSSLIQLTGGNFHFLQEWRPSTQPANIGDYYTASYYVVSNLGEKYGGMDYFKKFFELFNGTEVKDNNLLAYYLSLAADAPAVIFLRNVGFKVTDLRTFPLQMYKGEKAVDAVNPVFQPYKSIAEFVYRQAVINFEKGDVEKANRYVETAVFIAQNAPLLTLTTIAVLLAVAIYTLRRRREPSEQITPDQGQYPD